MINIVIEWNVALNDGCYGEYGRQTADKPL